jgi:hypothetical protein
MAAAAKQGSPQQGSQQAEAGKAVQQAQQQVGQAQSKMSQGQSQSAQASMKQAAQSMAKAAQSMAQNAQKPGQPGLPFIPSQVGAAGGGLPDLSKYGVDAKKYAGKTWGDLPGELRTRILQDMKSQFGDDYTRRIKLYFEQIAVTRKR